MAHRSDDLRHVGLEGRVIDRVHAHADTRRNRASEIQTLHQFGDELGMLGLGADSGTVLAVQRHVEDAGAEPLGKLGLQLQALAHARLDTAVMVTDRQRERASLGPQQYRARMLAHLQLLPVRPGGRRQLARRSVP